MAEPVLECAAVMDLLSRFVPDDITDGDVLRLLGMAAHAVGDTVRSVDFLSRSEALLREQARLGLLSHVLSMQVIDWLELRGPRRARGDPGRRAVPPDLAPRPVGQRPGRRGGRRARGRLPRDVPGRGGSYFSARSRHGIVKLKKRTGANRSAQATRQFREDACVGRYDW